VTELNPDAFDVVIVDEFHHAAAPTYRKLLERLFPADMVRLKPDTTLAPDATAAGPPQRGALQDPEKRILLELTATPERTDAGDILGFFDGHNCHAFTRRGTQILRVG